MAINHHLYQFERHISPAKWQLLLMFFCPMIASCAGQVSSLFCRTFLSGTCLANASSGYLFGTLWLRKPCALRPRVSGCITISLSCTNIVVQIAHRHTPIRLLLDRNFMLLMCSVVVRDVQDCCHYSSSSSSSLLTTTCVLKIESTWARAGNHLSISNKWNPAHFFLDATRK